MRIGTKRAFTLAEVMLAIGIIGTIAMMTIPAVSKNYQKHAYVVQAKKNLTAIESMLTNVQVDTLGKPFSRTGLSKRNGVNNLGDIRNTIGKYLDMDVSASNTTCFAPTYRSVDSSTTFDFECSEGTVFVLKGGAAYCYIPNENNSATIIVDTNGNKAPNTGGRDVFTYNISDDYSITDDGDCTSSSTGQGCLKRLMDNDWKLDY